MSEPYIWGQGAFPQGTVIHEWIEAWDDPDLSYEFDIAAFAKTDLGWYIVSGTGCSCHSDNPEVDWGPGDAEELAEYLKAEYANDKVSSCYAKKYAAMVEALGSIA